MKFDKSSGYAILIYNNLAGIIEIVDDLKNQDTEEIRNKYVPK
ncbi:hypothetical protein SH2C18_13890 [Clostridium sediminicola]